jgi:hypothetical protein
MPYVNMNVENNLLGLIKNKFPRQSLRIDELYEHDKEFRELCADYAACILALSKYKRLSKEGERSAEDYEKAIDDLEKEIYDFIFP